MHTYTAQQYKYICIEIWYYSHSASLWIVLHLLYSVAILRIPSWSNSNLVTTNIMAGMHPQINQPFRYSLSYVPSVVNEKQPIYVPPVIQCYIQTKKSTDQSQCPARSKNKLLNCLDAQQFEKCICQLIQLLWNDESQDDLCTEAMMYPPQISTPTQ